MLPVCGPVLEALGDGGRDALRDALQLHQQRGRNDEGAALLSDAHVAAVMAGYLPPDTAAARAGLASLAAPCVMGHLNRRLTPGRPQVSYLLQYYHRPHVIQSIVTDLLACRQSARAELLVNVDSGSEVAQWAALVASTNGFVVPVFSANIHEARAFNRLARMARGDVLVLMQDDDKAPGHCGHIKRVVQVMDKYSHIAIMGHRSFRYCFSGDFNRGRGNFADTDLGVHFNYAQVVSMAPLAVRRSAWEDVGGMDEGMSDVGVCGIWGDWELSMRMWLAGWHVAHMAVHGGLEHDTETVSGTHKPETFQRCWGRQLAAAEDHFRRRYSPALLAAVCALQRRLNLATLTLRKLPQQAACPFRTMAVPSRANCSLGSDEA